MPPTDDDSRKLNQASTLFSVICVVTLGLGIAFAGHVLDTNSRTGDWVLAVIAWVSALGAARVALRTRRAAR